MLGLYNMPYRAVRHAKRFSYKKMYGPFFGTNQCDPNDEVAV